MDNLQLLLLLFELSSKWGNNVTGGYQEKNNTDLIFSSLLKASIKSQGSNEIKEIADIQSPELGNQSVEEIIKTTAQKYGVDTNLIREVIRAESSFDVDAVSPAGAQGLMQLMPGTADNYGVEDPFDPIQNVEGGTHLLSDLLSRYKGNIPLALAAYNAGPGAVAKYNGIPPYSETKNYVNKIVANLNAIDKKI